jgi:hypothetical protein
MNQFFIDNLYLQEQFKKAVMSAFKVICPLKNRRLQMKMIMVLLLIPFFTMQLFSQKKVTPRLDFTYLKKNDGSRLLKAHLYILQNKITSPINGEIISFSVGCNFNLINITTNGEGIAYLIIDKKTSLKANSEGIAKLSAKYAGKDTIDSISSEIMVKDAFINLKLEEVDSVRTIMAQLTTLSSKSDTIPVNGIVIGFYVPRMFSFLKIGEETTDDEGKVTLEFPNDLPGNSDSTITVYARLDDNEVYSNVEVNKIARWGVPIIHRIPESHRTLWTEIAPLWMIVTLSIMLLGVWGHYIYVIIQLFLIKLESKKHKA